MNNRSGTREDAGFRMTIHATARKQQRGVLAAAMEAALAFGDTYSVGDGCVAYHLGHRAARRHHRVLRNLSDKARNLAVIVSPEGAIMSMYRVFRPKKRWTLA